MSRKSCLIRLFKTTVSCKLFTAIILSVFLVQPALTYAGVVIGGTRVVYLSNNPDKSISVFSKEEKIPYLIQAWVDPWICPYISRHLLSLNPLQARCRRYSRGER